MKLIIVIALSFFALININAQQRTEYRYFKNSKAKNPVEESVAKYIEETQYTNDSIKTVRLWKIKNPKLQWHNEYRKDKTSEDWHIWRSDNKVTYGQYKPSGYYKFDITNNQLDFDQADRFVAPKLSREDSDITGQCDWELESGFSKLIGATMRYPVKAQENGIQGEVVVQFVIDSKGEVGFVKIVKGVDPLLDDEAYRVIASIRQLVPAQLNGHNIGVYIEVPLNFVLR